MRSKSNIILLCAALLVPGLAAAEELTIEQCRQLALQNNKSRRIVSLSTEAAGYTRKSVWAQFFPDLSLRAFGLYDTGTGGLSYDLSGLAGNVGGMVMDAVQSGVITPQQAQWFANKASGLPGSVEMVDYKMDWVYGGSVVLKQPLYMGGKIRAAYRMSGLAVDMYREGERLSETQVIQKADEAYAKVVNAMELEQVALRYKELLQELESNVESSIRHGLGMENDRLKVQVKLNEVELQLRRARNGVRLAKMNLCHVTGRPLTDDVTVRSEYPAVSDAQELQAYDVSARPEYAMLDYRTQLAGQQVRMARSEMMPQLALLAKYGYFHGLEVNGNPMFDDWTFAGGVTLSVPLFHFGERSNKLKAARTKLEQARLEREDKMEEMQLELARAANNLDEARLEVTLSESSLQQAESNMKLTEQRYRAGLEPLSDCLEAQAQWQQAYETHVNSHFQLHLASVDYLRSAGLLVR